MSKYLDNDGLLYLWNSKIKPLVAKYLPLTGGTLTGKLTLGAAPNADMDAATKKYVDDSVASAGGGDMLKSVYDKDGNGVVDDAQKVNGHTVEKDVPADALATSRVPQRTVEGGGAKYRERKTAAKARKE